MTLLATFTRQAFMNLSAYRVHFLIEIFSRFLQLYVLTALWHVLHKQAPGAFAGVSESYMVTYACLGVILGIVLSTDVGPHVYIVEQVLKGSITSDLMKPLGFVEHMFLRSTGETIVRTVFYAVIPFAGSILFFGVQAPVNVTAGIGFAVSMVLSVVIFFFCNFLFGLISFRTLDLTGFQFAYWALIRFFSGALIPIWLYPAYMVKAIYVLPFQAMFATPLSIYIGRLTGFALAKALLVQLVWIALLGALASVVWKRIHRHLIVQGG